jgi:hypothetical protein
LSANSGKDFVPLRSIILYLPTELVAMVAETLCDDDLYNLTYVCHRLASIICPIFLSKLGLKQTHHMLSLKGESFKFLPMWR